MNNHWQDETAKQLPKGAFLMVCDNPMTIGWAQFGILWGKLCATVYVRHSRYTHELLEKTNTFTISVPKYGSMQKELTFCGTKSGRDVNKLEVLGLSVLTPSFGAQNGIKGCKYQIECHILHRSELDESRIENQELTRRYYANGDPHTMYIGEILGVTEAEII